MEVFRLRSLVDVIATTEIAVIMSVFLVSMILLVIATCHAQVFQVGDSTTMSLDLFCFLFFVFS